MQGQDVEEKKHINFWIGAKELDVLRKMACDEDRAVSQIIRHILIGKLPPIKAEGEE